MTTENDVYVDALAGSSNNADTLAAPESQNRPGEEHNGMLEDDPGVVTTQLI